MDGKSDWKSIPDIKLDGVDNERVVPFLKGLLLDKIRSTLPTNRSTMADSSSDYLTRWLIIGGGRNIIIAAYMNRRPL